MRVLRDIKTDLVEKRLWPVAALLVAALVAVPFLLGSSTPAKTAKSGGATPPPAAAPPPSGTSVVALKAPDARAKLAGTAKDPFIQRFLPKPPKTTGSTTGQPAPTGAGSTGTTGGSTGGTGGGTGGGTTGGGGNTGGGNGPAYTTATIDATLTKAGGRPRTYRGLKRLTPLPSSLDPILVFLGVLQDGKTAVFLVSSDAKAQGDGRCKPSGRICQTVQIQAGQTEFFDLTTTTGATVQYELDLIRVRTGAGSAKSAGRAAKAGRRALRDHGDAFALPPGYTYDPRTGRLNYRTPRAHGAGASGAARLRGVAQAITAVPLGEHFDFGS